MSTGLVLGALGGYALGTGRLSGRTAEAGNNRLEAYLTEQSFSEIENTKAKLQALCAQFVTGLPQLYESISPEMSARAPGSGTHPETAERTLELLGKAREQFRGTEPEGYIVEEMLIVLKRSGQSQRWLDLYLPFLYEHPTHPLVGRRAKEAVEMSDKVGRQVEVAEAFDVLRRIPLNSAAHDQVLACLNPTSAHNVSGNGAQANDELSAR